MEIICVFEAVGKSVIFFKSFVRVTCPCESVSVAIAFSFPYQRCAWLSVSSMTPMVFHGFCMCVVSTVCIGGAPLFFLMLFQG